MTNPTPTSQKEISDHIEQRWPTQGPIEPHYRLTLAALKVVEEVDELRCALDGLGDVQDELGDVCISLSVLAHRVGCDLHLRAPVRVDRPTPLMLAADDMVEAQVGAIQHCAATVARSVLRLAEGRKGMDPVRAAVTQMSEQVRYLAWILGLQLADEIDRRWASVVER